MSKVKFNESNIAHGVRAIVEDILKDVHTCMPAKIESVDGSTIDVKPLLKNPFTKTEYKVIPGVPFLMNEDSSLQVEVAAGDLVLLVFCERSLDRWTANGKVADTTEKRHFDLSDPFAIPLLKKDGTTSLQTLLTDSYGSAVENKFAQIVTAFTGLGVILTPFVRPLNGATEKVKAE